MNAYDKLQKEGKLATLTSVDAKIGEAQKRGLPLKNINLEQKDIDILLAHYANDKDNIEGFVAHRHGFTKISYRTGHDGIRKSDNKCFEVKNNAHSTLTGYSLTIIIDKLSENNYKKFKDDRPETILNGTRNGFMDFEIVIEFDDVLLALYKKALDEGKVSITIAFSSFRHAIKSVPTLNTDIGKYGANLLVEYMYETTGINYGLNTEYLNKVRLQEHKQYLLDEYAKCGVYAEVIRQYENKTGHKTSTKTIKKIMYADDVATEIVETVKTTKNITGYPKEAANQSGWITPSEAARILGVSNSTITYRRNHNKIESKENGIGANGYPAYLVKI